MFSNKKIFSKNRFFFGALILFLTIAVVNAAMSDTAQARAYSKKVKLIGQDMHQWEVESTDVGGTLIFSDSPEYVEDNGILYSDTVQGDGRVLFYHVNETQQTKHLAVVLENENDELISVHVSRGHTSKPDSNYMVVGKETQLGYFGRTLNYDLIIMPHRRKVLDPEMSRQILHSGDLVYGVYDFYSGSPVKVSVVMCPSNQDPAHFIKKARQLPKDSHMLRGTFQGMNRIITGKRPYDPEEDGPVFIPLADDYSDKYAAGVDVTDGSEALNYGNYGILYKLKLPTVKKGRTQYLFQPLGGIYAGAMTVANKAGKLTLLQTPGGSLYFGDTTLPETEAERMLRRDQGINRLKVDSELEDLGMYSNEEELVFEFSPPGASNLPVNFIMIPGK